MSDYTLKNSIVSKYILNTGYLVLFQKSSGDFLTQFCSSFRKVWPNKKVTFDRSGLISAGLLYIENT